MKGSIPLFWWSEPRLMGKEKENYGDLLSCYLVKKISGKTVQWVKPRQRNLFRITPENYMCIGSILQHGNGKSIVWGSGIIDRDHKVKNARFRAVRGPETRLFLRSKGYECPEVYGDPALLLPSYFNPSVSKMYEIGIIPHYVDYPAIKKLYRNNEKIKVIDVMTLDIESKTTEIIECKKIISSSLHGLIIGHTYGIPSLHVKFSEKIFGDGVKYLDYYQSVDLNFKEPINLEAREYELKGLVELIENKGDMPEKTNLDKIKLDLMKTCPFID